MKHTHRPAPRSHVWPGYLLTLAIALGTVSGAALSTGPAGATNNKRVTVSVMSFGSMGKVLVAKGKPLYFLKANANPCTTACLKVWPALTLPASVKKATAGNGVKSAKLGTTAGPNGVRQVTYEGQPVYWFAFDNTRGKVKGNITDQWGKWTAVVVSKGSPAPAPASGSSGNSGANAGSGGASF
jgi:predicted lipoprotein with Yx(FWY)xxD motif